MSTFKAKGGIMRGVVGRVQAAPSDRALFGSGAALPRRARAAATAFGLCLVMVVLVGMLAPASASANGTAYAWGSNLWGEQGIGSTVFYGDKPAVVNNDQLAISAGWAHSLTLEGGSGLVWAMGFNADGQLGLEETSGPEKCAPFDEPEACSITPRTVKGGLANATGISASGDGFSLAVEGGKVMAWGENDTGQLGDGKTTATDKPVEVTGLSKVLGVAAGIEDGYALLESGKVMAWGRNVDGALGTGNTTGSGCALPCSLTPVEVIDLNNEAVQISAGDEYALARLKSGKVMAWGKNVDGELGNGATGGGSCECDATPAPVKNLSKVTDISAGTYHALAVEGGRAEAWGFNEYGELGNGTYGGGTCNCDPTPAPVKNLSKVGEVAAGKFHSLALEGSTVWAWGNNLYDPLGNGVVNEADVPELVNGLPSGIVEISAGQEDSMALTQYAAVIKFTRPVVIYDKVWEVHFYGTVNPEGAEVTTCKIEYGRTREYGASVPCSPMPGSGDTPVEVSATIEGLTANASYYYRIVATNSGGTAESAATFETVPAPTVVTSGAIVKVLNLGVTLEGTVNPNGGEVSECYFEYGTTTSYGSEAPCAALPGSGTSPVEVSSVTIKTGLAENTVYHYRIVATNGGGTSYGGDETFKTFPGPPTVVTGAPSAVSQTSATLNATVNPNGATVTECYFEWGTTTSYGSPELPCSSLPGSGTSPVAVSATLTGLTPNTVYHYRIVAFIPGALIARGGDESFSTHGPPEFGRCVKISKGTGGFSSATCTVKKADGSYEWYPGVEKANFTTKLASGTVVLESSSREKVKCTSETSGGYYEELKYVNDVVLTFEGCEMLGEKCGNSLTPGVIYSDELAGALGIVKLGASTSKNKIGLDLFPVGRTTEVMSFSCGATSVAVYGSVIVPVKANKMSLTQALKFKASKGEQRPESFVGGSKDVLDASFNGAAQEPLGLTLTTTQTSEEEVEVNSVV